MTVPTGYGEEVGDLGVGQLLDVDEQQHRTKSGVQGGERRLDPVVHDRVDDGVFGAAGDRDAEGGAVPGVDAVTEQLGALPAQRVQVGVPQDGQQPGPGVGAVETADVAVGADQGVLDQVLGVGPGTGQGVRDSQQDLDLRLDVDAERVVSTGRRAAPRCGTR